MEKRAVSIAEAAKAIGISTSLAYDLVKLGQLPVVRFGKRMVVPVRALDQYLEEHLVEVAS